MALSAGESYSGGQVRDSKSRTVVISETTNAAVSAGEFYSAGFLCDPDSRTVICQDAAHSALAAGETLTGGDVRDKVGRIACAAETLNAPISAGSQFSDGWLNDSQGRRIIAIDTLGAALSAAETFTSGQVRDSVGRLVIALEVAPGSPYDAAVLADSPIGYWPLSEPSGTTAIDTTGNGHSGTYGGTFTLGQPGAGTDGKTGVLFDGATGFAAIPDSPALRFTGPYTVEAWGKQTAYSGTQYMVAKTTNATDGWIFDLEGSTGTPNLYCAGTQTPGLALPAAGSWNHVAATYDGVNVNFYVNGAPSVTRAFTTNPTTTVANMQIGRYPSGAFFFNGSMAKVAVYGTALSVGRIAAHYAAR